MTTRSTNALTTVILLPFLLWLPGCESINCYTCSSVNGSNPHCEDPINTHLSEYTEKCMVPKKNHVGLFPANFCIKITGVNTDTYERIVIRACVMKTMDSQCGMFKYQDQAMNGCVLTCDYNGCNKAQRNSHVTFNHLILPIVALSVRQLL
ncbi:hypothetical protein RUM44_003198 [Polyplax serrata]|uniref:Protein sleepless n=1 Tax=Polyplax serrata TaxID=468196 RepID=A0ABR1AXY6_POLSC